MRRILSLLVNLVIILAAHAAEDPLTLTAAHDTVINPGTLGAPDGWSAKAEDLMVYGPKHGNPNYRSLIQFDLKDVPKAVVTCAILKLQVYKLYAVRKTNLDIVRVHRLLRPWQEKSASWGHSVPGDEWYNKGGDFDPAASAGTPLDIQDSGENPGKAVQFDLTPLVQAWQQGTPNFGIILLNTDNDSETTFRPFSANAKNDSDRPKLVLYWKDPPKKNPEFIKPSVLKPVGQAFASRIQLNPSLRQGRVGEKYEDFVKGKGGIFPYSYKASGDFPEGLSMSPEGQLTGLPVKPGKYTVTINITDALKRSGSGKLTFDVIEPDRLAGKKDPEKKGEGKADDKPTEKKPQKPIDEE